MHNMFLKQIQNITEHKWKLDYDQDSHTAKKINGVGEEMDLNTFGFCIDALQNEIYDKNSDKYGMKKVEPHDEFTRKRFGLTDYKLINDEQNKNVRTIFGVYGDTNQIFTLEKFNVIGNRKTHENGFCVYLNIMDAKKLLESLCAFIERNSV